MIIYVLITGLIWLILFQKCKQLGFLDDDYYFYITSPANHIQYFEWAAQTYSYFLPKIATTTIGNSSYW